MRSMPAVLTLALLLAASLTGCQKAWNSFGDWSTDLLANKKVDEDPIILDIAGPVTVDVESFSGDVTVVADSTLERGMVTITRHSRFGYKRTEESAATLDDITYTIDLVPAELGQALIVRTQTSNAEPHFQSIDLLIEVPDVEGLRVRTSHGDVEARDIVGDVDIINTDGDVRVMTSRPMVRPVTIINNAGSIDFRVRGESRGQLDFQSVRGKVMHVVRFGDMRVFPGTTHNTLVASFNDGDNPYVLRAADGNVRFAVVEAPTAVGRHIVD